MNLLKTAQHAKVLLQTPEKAGLAPSGDSRPTKTRSGVPGTPRTDREERMQQILKTEILGTEILGTEILETLRRTALAATTAVAAVALASAALAQNAVDLSGKTVEFVIPFTESGGSARWANFFAPLLSEALPGKPTVVVKYMPGAGSTKGANWFQGEQDVGDGTLIFGSSGSTQFPYLLGDPRVRYEYDDWQVVLASGVGGVAYLPKDLGARFDGDADDLKDVTFIWGAQNATGLDLVPNLAWKMLGMKVEPVFGVEGRGPGRLMFERGEANIDYQTSPAYLRSVVPMVEQELADLQGGLRGDRRLRDQRRCLGRLESFLHRRLPGAEDGVPAEERAARGGGDLRQGLQGDPRPAGFRRACREDPGQGSADDRQWREEGEGAGDQGSG
jgi:hypothetical protein